MNESDLEDVCLGWLEGFGWGRMSGDDLTPGGLE